MKPRRWVLVLVAVLAILVGALQWLRGYLERRLDLERLVAEHIEPVFGGEFEVRHVGLRFLSVYLQGVSATLPLNAAEIEIQDIKVGFSLRRLLLTRGDIGRSISKIVFVRPRLTIRLTQEQTGRVPEKDRGPPLSLSAEDLPVEYLQVRRGSVRIIGLADEEFVLGEFLNGHIVGATKGVRFELHGRLASLRRNLALSGTIGARDERSRLSLRLDGARLSVPLQFHFGTISDGRADGLCEMAFGSTAESFDATGWVRIRDGVAHLPPLPHPISDLNLGVRIEGTQCLIDSLGGSYNGMIVHAGGKWDLLGRTPGNLAFEAESFDVDRMLPDLPPALHDNLYGVGRVRLHLRQGERGAPLTLRFSGGGISVLGMPLTSLEGAASLEEGRVRVESLAARTMAASLTLQGTAVVDSAVGPYRVSYELAVDSLPTVPWYEGRVRVAGSASGLRGIPQMDVRVDALDARVYGIPIGSRTLEATYRGNKVSFATKYKDTGSVFVKGTLTEPFAATPTIDCSARIASRMVRSFIEHVSPVSDPVSGEIDIEAHIVGKLPQWQAEATLALNTSRVRGQTELRAWMDTGAEGHVAWQLLGRDLHAGSRPFPLAAAGRMTPEMLLVDSSSFLRGIGLEGRVGLTQADNVELSVTYDNLSLEDLNAWLFDGQLPVSSGTISGGSRISGFRSRIVSSSEVRIRNAAVGELGPLAADAVVTTSEKGVRVLPMVIRKGGAVALSLDTIAFGDRVHLAGEFDGIDVASFLGPALLEDMDIDGRVSGSFTSTDSGYPIDFQVRSDRLTVATAPLDSVRLHGSLDSARLSLERISARESDRCELNATATVPLTFLNGEPAARDTLRAHLRIEGDMLASFGELVEETPVGGDGDGVAVASFIGTMEGLHFDTFAVTIPHGMLTAGPYIPDSIREFTLNVALRDSGKVHTYAEGVIGRRPVKLTSSHTVPKGYKPFQLGPLNFGVIFIETSKNGISLHLPGFHERGERVEVEFKPLSPFPAFALSGPVDKVKITGLWILRSCQFTFPVFESDEIDPDMPDPFPFIDWEFDVTPGNRNVMYYWEVSGKRRRRLIRFVEAYLDPISRIKLRGRELDNTFRVLGSIRSYKGSVYFGKVFERRFEAGLDFAPEPLPHGGYNNMPIMWGSAEAFSDTSRLDRVKLTLHLIDPVTGGVSERGRVAMIPRPRDARRDDIVAGEGDSITNFSFHLSSDFEQIAGESQREFYREAGLRFSSFEGAGEFVSSMGEQYLHRYLLQRFERRLARRLGLDVISFETSIASNYFRRFYNRESSDISEEWDLLALAHVGITIGRYFFRDNLFIKARGELIPDEELLVPEYSIGFELQPVRYLFLDFNYGFHRGQTSIEHDPRMNLQLRLPLTRLRKAMNF